MLMMLQEHDDAWGFKMTNPDEAHVDANDACMHDDDDDDIAKDTEVNICIWHILKIQKQT